MQLFNYLLSKKSLSHGERFRVGLLACTILIFSLANAQNPFKRGKIIVRVGDFISLKGKLVIGLFDSLNVNGNGNLVNSYKYKIIPVDDYFMTVVFDSIPVGKYAIKVVHDENSNQKFDYFSEDYGFSFYNHAGRGQIKLKKALFAFDGTDMTVNVFLENEKLGKYKKYQNSTAFSPVLGYTPETSVLLGANVIRLFKFKNADSLTRTSYADVFGALTFNKQVIIEQNYNIFTNSEKYLLIGFTGYQHFPQYYYGVGNNLPQENKVLVSYSDFRFEHLALKKIYKKLFAGIGYRYHQVFNVSSPANSVLNDSVTGHNGSAASGVQFAILSDSRNNIFNTSKGHLIKIKATINPKFMGSRNEFQVIELDFRKFIKLFKQRNDVLALQAYGYFASGDVPWIEMGTLGNTMIMRGYYSGRYREKNYMAVQAEYRLSLNRTFGLVAFAGTGDVAKKMGDFNLWDLKPSFGFGARMRIDRIERLNLRLDYGFGNNGNHNFYFTIAEAF
jgi:uncharacterized protein (DUF2141 family)